ncbi:hypothetical protein HanPSC8_Chr17g0790941 [Helianthus annuus]|nr:hypothetical protein HanPSC8_Chr17g0790941 [Helianthus annuus]
MAYIDIDRLSNQKGKEARFSICLEKMTSWSLIWVNSTRSRLKLYQNYSF